MADNVSLIGRILYKYSLLTPEQFDEVVKAHSQMDGVLSIGELLQHRGHLTPEQGVWLAQAVRHYEQRLQRIKRQPQSDDQTQRPAADDQLPQLQIRALPVVGPETAPEASHEAISEVNREVSHEGEESEAVLHPSTRTDTTTHLDGPAQGGEEVLLAPQPPRQQQIHSTKDTDSPKLAGPHATEGAALPELSAALPICGLQDGQDGEGELSAALAPDDLELPLDPDPAEFAAETAQFLDHIPARDQTAPATQPLSDTAVAEAGQQVLTRRPTARPASAVAVAVPVASQGGGGAVSRGPRGQPGRVAIGVLRPDKRPFPRDIREARRSREEPLGESMRLLTEPQQAPEEPLERSDLANLADLADLANQADPADLPDSTVPSGIEPAAKAARIEGSIELVIETRAEAATHAPGQLSPETQASTSSQDAPLPRLPELLPVDLPGFLPPRSANLAEPVGLTEPTEPADRAGLAELANLPVAPAEPASLPVVPDEPAGGPGPMEPAAQTSALSTGDLQTASESTASEQEFARLLQEAADNGGDLHLHVGLPPLLLQHGASRTLPLQPQTADLNERLLWQLLAMQPPSPDRHDYRFAHSAACGRFRVTAVRHLHGWDLSFRPIQQRLPTLEQLGLDSLTLLLARSFQDDPFLGRLLVCGGPPGCGKTSTMMALIERLRRNAPKARPLRVLLIEELIERDLHPTPGVVHQRQVGLHTHSVTAALNAAAYGGYDLIAIDELRRGDELSLVLQLLGAGQRVLLTRTAGDVRQVIEGLLDLLPPRLRRSSRGALGSSLVAVLSQRLWFRKAGPGQIAAHEILLGTPAVAELIERDRLRELSGHMAQHRNSGHRSLEDTLAELREGGLID